MTNGADPWPTYFVARIISFVLPRIECFIGSIAVEVCVKCLLSRGVISTIRQSDS